MPEDVWDALIPHGHPFLTWRFLRALEQSGCAVNETGWAPYHLAIKDRKGDIAAVAMMYAKSHSRGEYVFDHGWADALERAGGRYYPKLQVSVPFTPVTGPRLLAATQEDKIELLNTMKRMADETGCSGVHLTFLNDEDRQACEAAGWLLRQDRQFHFINRGYESFEDFLSALSSRKRKNIRKERKAANDGLTIKRLIGDDLTPAHWDVFYECYLDTGARKWGMPYLNREFFDLIHQTMRDEVLLVMAFEDDTPIASALNFIGADALYGRNWGALKHVPFLHFELCYYQAIEAGIELGLSRVEAGAQGEHKLARGYEPVTTYSAHYLRHPGLHEAVADFLTRERRAVDHEVDILSNYTPFKKG